MDTEELEYQQTNRENRQGPKSGSAYCFACDGGLVGDGRKCPRCGKRHLAGHFRKRRYKPRKGELKNL